MMNYNDFEVAFVEAMREAFPECEVVLGTAIKTNVVLTSVTVKSPDINMAPSMYPEYLYDAYRQDEDFEGIVENAVASYRKAMDEAVPFDVNEILDYENIKGKILAKLVNKNTNKELLEVAPHRILGDELAVIYYIPLGFSDGLASITVKNDQLEYWGGVSEETLYNDAVNNMEDTVAAFDMFKFNPAEINFEEVDLQESPSNKFLILTNKDKLNGAAVILTKKMQQFIAKIANPVLIPSSIHEFLVLSNDEDEPLSTFDSMVDSVSSTEVRADEVLAYRAFTPEMLFA